uniref:Protocadherin-16 n=1 Tax=Macrostomum lignano TaxID=282301 RepID=A0A1I8H890_9PLAT
MRGFRMLPVAALRVVMQPLSIMKQLCIAISIAATFSAASAKTGRVELRHSFVEELPVGSRVADLRRLLREQAGRADADSPELEFTTLSDAGGLLSVDPASGAVEIRSRIDRESICSLVDTCCPSASSQDCRLSPTVGLLDSRLPAGNFRDIIQLELDVIDVNDNAPRWTMARLQLEMAEHTQPGERISLQLAEDPDRAPDNTTSSYSLLSASQPGAFRVAYERRSGGRDPTAAAPHVWLEVLADLDRETRPNHELVIAAVDGAARPLTGSVTVSVQLIDINDNAPVFKRRYDEGPDTVVPESLPPGSELLRVEATDRDQSDSLSYRFSVSASQAVLNDFKIDAKTGVISVQQLDYEIRREYSIPVTVSDGKHPVETTVKVRVQNVNDNPPVITVKSVQPDAAPTDALQILEKSPPGSLIATADVKDADDKGMEQRLDCSVQPPGQFDIRPLYESAKHQFKIVSSVSFDREIRASYSAEIVCRDGGSPSQEGRHRLRIDVTDVNDNPPTFAATSVRASLAENSGAGAFVAQLHADDPDEGANGRVRYSIAPTSAADFNVDAYNGTVTARRSFDREKVDVLNAFVFAEDSPRTGGREALTATASLVVEIADLNDCRPQLNRRRYDLAVEEGAAAGARLGSATAVDCDVEPRHRNVSFRLEPDDSSGGGLVELFRVSPDGGVFTTGAGELDREQRDSHSFLLVADDGAGLADTAQVSVSVLDRNDNRPRWMFPGESGRTLNISQHRPVGSPIAHLHAIDADYGDNGTVVYSLLAPQPYDNLFVVSRDGVLSLGRPVDPKRDLSTVHRLVLNASDRGRPRPLNSIETMEIRILEQPDSAFGGPSARTSESNLVIIVAMVTVTLAVSLVLIGAIFCLRCRTCGGRRRRRRGKVNRQQQQEQQQLPLTPPPSPPPPMPPPPLLLGPSAGDYSPNCGYHCDSAVRPDPMADSRYQVQLPLSPLDSEATRCPFPIFLRYQFVPLSNLAAILLQGKILLDDAESLDSGKGCSSDNGSRSMKAAKADFHATLGIDGKHLRAAQHHQYQPLPPPPLSHQAPPQYQSVQQQQPVLSTFRYSVSHDPMATMPRRQHPDSGRPPAAVHFQQHSHDSSTSTGRRQGAVVTFSAGPTEASSMRLLPSNKQQVSTAAADGRNSRSQNSSFVYTRPESKATKIDSDVTQSTEAFTADLKTDTDVTQSTEAFTADLKTDTDVTQSTEAFTADLKTDTDVTRSIEASTEATKTDTEVTRSIEASTADKKTDRDVTRSIEASTEATKTDTDVTRSIEASTEATKTDTDVTRSIEASTADKKTDRDVTRSIEASTADKKTDRDVTRSIEASTEATKTDTDVTRSIEASTEATKTDTEVTRSIEASTADKKTDRDTDTEVTRSIEASTADEKTDTEVTRSIEASTADEKTDTEVTRSIEASTEATKTDTEVTRSIEASTADLKTDTASEKQNEYFTSPVGKMAVEDDKTVPTSDAIVDRSRNKSTSKPLTNSTNSTITPITPPLTNSTASARSSTVSPGRRSSIFSSQFEGTFSERPDPSNSSEFLQEFLPTTIRPKLKVTLTASLAGWLSAATAMVLLIGFGIWAWHSWHYRAYTSPLRRLLRRTPLHQLPRYSSCNVIDNPVRLDQPNSRRPSGRSYQQAAEADGD